MTAPPLAMFTPEPILGLGPQDREVLLRFAAHHRRLLALPRRTRRSMQRRWRCTLAAIALCLALGQAPASAAIIEVTAGVPPSISADGKCSLIEAIVNANRDQRTHLDCVAGAGADTILLPPRSTQRLGAAQSLPWITSQVSIEGRRSTIQRNATQESYRAFFHVGATGDLTLRQITVSGATTSGVPGGSPGIRNDGGRLRLIDSRIIDAGFGLENSGGVATLENSTISGNSSEYGGGGLSNSGGGTLTLTNSIVTGNVSWLGTPGIFNDVNSRLTVVDSVVSNNVVSYENAGGGIKNRGTLLLVGSTVSGNRADIGAGIFNVGTATLVDSTVSGNRTDSAYSYGGGGIASAGPMTLDNCTVSGNEAPHGGGLYAWGDDALSITNSTVTGNVSRNDLGGAGIFVQKGTLTLRRSIVSGNTASLRPDAREIRVTDYYATNVVTADDHNLFGHSDDAGIAGFTPGASDIVPAKSIGGILLPLADNGGTRTHALAIGSPALDASPDDATCPATDQRGNPRPRGPACDIGAFEGVAVTCNGAVTTMVGTVGDDRLTGTPGRDVIHGLSGDDTIFGLGANDVICGGFGEDLLYGGPGADLLFGEPGTDYCDGGPHYGAGDTATACETVVNVP